MVVYIDSAIYTHIQNEKETYLLPVQNRGKEPVQEPRAPSVCLCVYVCVSVSACMMHRMMAG